MFCSARLILVVVWAVIDIFCKPGYMGERITVRWWWWERFVMPIVMESSMFSCSIGKFISNHTYVGFVNGSIWFVNQGEDLFQNFWTWSLLCVCFLQESKLKTCWALLQEQQVVAIGMGLGRSSARWPGSFFISSNNK